VDAEGAYSALPDLVGFKGYGQGQGKGVREGGKTGWYGTAGGQKEAIRKRKGMGKEKSRSHDISVVLSSMCCQRNSWTLIDTGSCRSIVD